MSKILKYITLLLILSINTAGAQTLGFKILNNKKRIKIPFELYSNLIVVPVVLNNQLPLKFVLDTGVRTTILTEKAFSDILNLPYSRKYTIAGIGDNADQGIEAYVTNGVSLTLPGIKGLGHAMLVLEEDYLELRNYLGTDVHGVLGYELFSRFVIKVDYDNKMLTLTTPEYFHPSGRYDELDISVEDTKPYITGRLSYEGQVPLNLKLMVDSGASHGLLLKCDSDERLKVPEPYLESNLGRGLAGDLHGKIGRVSNFAMGKRSWDDILVTFPDNNTVLDSIKGTTVFRNGSVGGAILSRFKVIFDFPEEKIYLKKGKGFRKSFDYSLSGVNVKAKGSRLNTFEITEVRSNSEAEKAGLKPGDIILEINNLSVKRLNLELITGLLNQRKNKTVRLSVKRDAEVIRTKFKLKSPI